MYLNEHLFCHGLQTYSSFKAFFYSHYFSSWLLTMAIKSVRLFGFLFIAHCLFLCSAKNGKYFIVFFSSKILFLILRTKKNIRSKSIPKYLTMNCVLVYGSFKIERINFFNEPIISVGTYYRIPGKDPCFVIKRVKRR